MDHEPGPISFFSVALSDEADHSSFVPTKPRASIRQRSLIHYKRQGTAPARRRHGLSRQEFKELDFNRFHRCVRRFKQQESTTTSLPFVCFNRYCGASFILCMGLALILLGMTCFLWGGSAQSFEIPYKEGDSALTWKVTKPLAPPFHIYAGISNFFGNQRAFVQSRLGMGLYRCAGFTDVASAKVVRSAESFPEVLGQGLENSKNLSPCGVAQYSYFNDNFTFPSEITSNYDEDQSSVIFPERYLLYTTLGDPELSSYVWNTPSKSPRMQSWSTPPFAPKYLVMISTFTGTEPVPVGDYNIQVNDNLWPADAWIAEKSLIIQSLGKAGTQQFYVGVISIGYGGMLVLTSLAIVIALYTDKGKRPFRKWKSEVAVESESDRAVQAPVLGIEKPKKSLGVHHVSVVRTKVVPTLEPLPEYS